MLFTKICLEEYIDCGHVPFRFKGKTINLYVMREDEEENLVTRENLRYIESVLSDIKTWDYLYINEAQTYIDAAEDAMLENYNIRSGKDLYNICNITGISCIADTLAIHGKYFIDPEHGFLITFPKGKFVTSPVSKQDRRVSLFVSGDTSIETLYAKDYDGDESKQNSVEEVLELITINNKSAEIPVFRAQHKRSEINIKLLNKVLNDDRTYEIILRKGQLVCPFFRKYRDAKALRNNMLENIWYIDEEKSGNPFINIHFVPDIKIGSYNVYFIFNCLPGFVKWGYVGPSKDSDLKNKTKSEYNINLDY